VFDRDAASRAADDRMIEAAIEKEEAARDAQEARQSHEREGEGTKDRATARGRYADLPAPEPASDKQPNDTRPLGKTAGDIRMAWQTSRTASELEEALAARGINLAEVSPDEARASQRRAAFAKETGNFVPVFKEGEIVAVNQHGEVHPLNRRNTGDERAAIDGRLAGLDRANLLGVADTADVLREAARASYADEARQWRAMNKPLTGIEQTIADALTSTMTGYEFAAALDKAGITIARANAADIPALDVLRDTADLARLVAHTDEADIHAARNVVNEARRFDQLAEGDYAAVTRSGDVIRLNPTALDFEEAEQRLADVEPRLPSIIEARAQKEIAREKNAELWADVRADNAEAQLEGHDAFAGDQAFRRTVADAEHGVEAALHAADATVNRGMHTATGLGGLAAKAVEKVLGGLFSFFGANEPKLTPMQRELAAKADAELADVRAVDAVLREKEARQDELIFRQDRQQQHEDLERELGYRDPTLGRERERERY
jgi:hypothetical protein